MERRTARQCPPKILQGEDIIDREHCRRGDFTFWKPSLQKVDCEVIVERAREFAVESEAGKEW